MAKKPKLVKISEIEYGCSFGDWKKQELKPSKMSYAQWERRRQRQFDEHVKQRHSGEDFNQAAARIVREATRE
ncbi:MAG: hypothetical protein WB763_01280 [Terriglobia bacterium]